MGLSATEIKTKALARLIKEKVFYNKEYEEMAETAKELAAESQSHPEDEELKYKLKKQYEIVDESKRMIPAVQNKISTLLSGLRDEINENKSSISESELADANAVMVSAEKELGLSI